MTPEPQLAQMYSRASTRFRPVYYYGLVNYLRLCGDVGQEANR